MKYSIQLALNLRVVEFISLNAIISGFIEELLQVLLSVWIEQTIV
jgi:hypothetical protein